MIGEFLIGFADMCIHRAFILLCRISRIDFFCFLAFFMVKRRKMQLHSFLSEACAIFGCYWCRFVVSRMQLDDFRIFQTNFAVDETSRAALFFYLE